MSLTIYDAYGRPKKSVRGPDVPMDAVHLVGAAGEPPFQNSWVNYDAARPARFRKYPNGKVRLWGLIKNGGIGASAFTLPSSHWPQQEGYYAAAVSGGLGTVIVGATGMVLPTTSPNAATFQFLDGIEFDTGLVTSLPGGPMGPPGGGLVGAPIPWLVSIVPGGYLEFNGQAITQVSYPQLFALFGATLPDLRDRFLMGAGGAAVGAVGGEASHTLTTAEMPSHGHGVSTGPTGHTGGTAYNGSAFAVFSFSPDYINNGAGAYGVPWSADPAGGGAAHENRPPFRAVRWITVAA